MVLETVTETAVSPIALLLREVTALSMLATSAGRRMGLQPSRLALPGRMEE